MNLPTEAEVAQLSEAFDRVKNADHWKNPIDAVVGADDPPLITIMRAIEFYTATEASAVYLGGGKFRVTAPGYYAGPAN